jgi:hypothetical protein
MKYICFWEFKPEDFDKMIEKYKQAMEDREKVPDKFPKILFGPYSLGGEWKGFTVYDATPEQMTNLALHYMPEEKLKFVPIVDSKKAIELYLEMKK